MSNKIQSYIKLKGLLRGRKGLAHLKPSFVIKSKKIYDRKIEKRNTWL